MKKHKNKLLTLAGCVLVLVIGLVLVGGGSVFGKQPGQTQNVSWKTVKITVNYQDFQTAPVSGDNRALNVFASPNGSEILSVYAVVTELFTPSDGESFIAARPISPTSGGLCSGISPGDSFVLNSPDTINKPKIVLLDVFCDPSDQTTIAFEGPQSFLDNTTQGNMDVYLTYFQH